MSRTLTEVLARRLDEDAALIEEMLLLVPAGKQGWRPDWPLAFTVEGLAAHLVESWGGVCGCFQRLHPQQMAKLTALQEQIAKAGEARLAASQGLLGECREKVKEGFLLTSDEDLGRRVPTYFNPGGEPFLEILLTNLKHVNHHAHQLFVYLKLMGVAVETRHLYRFRETQG